MKNGNSSSCVCEKSQQGGIKVKLFTVRNGIGAVALALLLAAFTKSLWAQDSVNLEYDLSYASQTLPNGRYHVMRARTPAGLSAPLEGPEPLTPEQGFQLPLLSPPPVPGVPSPGFYEGDVSKIAPASPTLSKAVFNPIFVNCSTGSTCWGNPNAFLTDLGKSTFIHLTDQYTEVVGSFSLGKIANVKMTLHDHCMIGGTHPCLTDADIVGLVNFVASQAGFGSGYGHLFHVFLPKGVDVCLAAGECYSPDVPADDTICAYHSFEDQSAGHLLYSAEPFQVDPGCATAPPNVNGVLADSTDSTLSHETFEAISDPDILAFHDLIASSLFLQEIGDICQGPLVFDSSGNLLGIFVPTLVLNGHKYKSQLMYSNHFHACAPS
jgi:hypothetical protein